MPPEIWSFLEIDGEKLDDTAYKMAAEARRTAAILNADPCGVIVSPYHFTCPRHIKYYGLKKFYLLHATTPLSPETIAHFLHEAATLFTPKMILFAHTPLGADIAARVASSLKRGVVTQCTDFVIEKETLLARKPLYKGKVDALITWLMPPPYLATIEGTSLEDVKLSTETEPEIIRRALPPQASHTRLIKKWKVPSSSLNLDEARLVIGVGKGVSSSFMGTIERLAEMMEAVIGGTRIAVYSGLIPLERQIGTTGKWLANELYLAIGISGAPQHAMGIKEVKTTIAINKTREAPIFRYATLGIIGDLYEVIPSLITLLEQKRNAAS